MSFGQGPYQGAASATATVSAPLVLSGSSAPTLTSTITDSSAATQLESVRIQHQSSIAGTVGIGVYASFWASNATPALAEAARIKGILRGVSAGSENGAIEFVLNAAGTPTSAGHITGTTINGATAIGVGSISATGVTTQAWSVTGNSSSMNGYANGNAAVGGHAFSGTVNTSGARSFFITTPSANTSITASTERITHCFGSAHTNGVPGLTSIVHTWAAGALATQRDTVFVAPTYAFASASTITTAATVAIAAAPIAGTNATITKSHSLWIQGGLPRIDSATANGSVATVLGSVGPAGSNTTVQTWLTVDINGTTRYIPCF